MMASSSTITSSPATYASLHARASTSSTPDLSRRLPTTSKSTTKAAAVSSLTSTRLHITPLDGHLQRGATGHHQRCRAGSLARRKFTAAAASASLQEWTEQSTAFQPLMAPPIAGEGSSDGNNASVLRWESDAQQVRVLLHEKPFSSVMELGAAIDEDSGPIELRGIDPWAIPEVGPVQTAASVALSMAITFLLVRSAQRRSKNAKNVRIRSDALEPASSREGVDKRKAAAMAAAEAEAKNKPTVLGTVSGAVVAGTISFLLYKFTTHVESSLSLQPLSDQYTVRNITVALRTIINGLCYLATFVFAANAIGLSLFAMQLILGLAPDPVPPPSPDGTPLETSAALEEREKKVEGQSVKEETK